MPLRARDRQLIQLSIVISGGFNSFTLKYVILPLITNEMCKASKTIYGSNQLTETMVCAGFQQGGKDACQGSVIMIMEFDSVTGFFYTD